MSTAVCSFARARSLVWADAVRGVLVANGYIATQPAMRNSRVSQGGDMGTMDSYLDATSSLRLESP